MAVSRTRDLSESQVKPLKHYTTRPHTACTATWSAWSGTLSAGFHHQGPDDQRNMLQTIT